MESLLATGESADYSIHDFIARGEGADALEFKSSVRWDFKLETN
ncbi:MAG: hypothetical protein WKF78_02805 [Candidatus Limnocylindrales bacterium]